MFEVYRAFHLKLPHSNWTGIVRLIDWTLVQPLVLCVGALLLALAAMLRFVAIMMGPLPAPTVSEPLLPKPPISVLPTATPDDRTRLIEEAYRRLDAVEKISTPARHLSGHQ